MDWGKYYEQYSVDIDRLSSKLSKRHVFELVYLPFTKLLNRKGVIWIRQPDL